MDITHLKLYYSMLHHSWDDDIISSLRDAANRQSPETPWESDTSHGTLHSHLLFLHKHNCLLVYAQQTYCNV